MLIAFLNEQTNFNYTTNKILQVRLQATMVKRKKINATETEYLQKYVLSTFLS